MTKSNKKPAADAPASAEKTETTTVSTPAAAPAGEATGETGAVNAAEEAKKKVSYSVSGGFTGLLARLNLSVALTSYQSGKFYLLGRNPKGGLMINERLFQKAMGIWVEGTELVLATLFQIQRFQNVLKKGQFINHTYDACYVPRITHTTGVLDAHDVGLTDKGEIVFVNTRYNCLATVDAKDSFTPIWKPTFINQIVAEDRCHLNGMAMENGRPAFVTAVSRSNTIDGWRDRRGDGGVVIDVRTNEVVCEGLSMPHSPRLHNGKLWVLNSGTGELGTVDLENKKFKPVVFCPGFVRGLAFSGKYAFIGLSKPRYQRFEGLALDQRLKDADSEPWCGIQVIDTETGTVAEWFRIDGAIGEVYDVNVLPGVACPMSLGFVADDIKGFITHGEVNEEFLKR